MSSIAGFVRAVSLSIIFINCVLAIIFDPEAAYTRERRVGRRVVKVKRPLVEFKALEYCLEIPEVLGEWDTP